MIKISELPSFDIVDQLKTKEDLKDYYFVLNVLQRVRFGKEEIFTTHEVMKALGLED